VIGIHHKYVPPPIPEFFAGAQDDYLGAEISRCTAISLEHNDARAVIRRIGAINYLVPTHSPSEAGHAEVGDDQDCGQSDSTEG